MNESFERPLQLICTWMTGLFLRMNQCFWPRNQHLNCFECGYIIVTSQESSLVMKTIICFSFFCCWMPLMGSTSTDTWFEWRKHNENGLKYYCRPSELFFSFAILNSNIRKGNKKKSFKSLFMHAKHAEYCKLSQFQLNGAIWNFQLLWTVKFLCDYVHISWLTSTNPRQLEHIAFACVFLFLNLYMHC